MFELEQLAERIKTTCGDWVTSSVVQIEELSIEVQPAFITTVLTTLRDDEALGFEQLIDLCGVDYGAYGDEDHSPDVRFDVSPKLAVVYHLLSMKHNTRIRVRCRLEQDHTVIASVVDIWPVANWFEREAFDMYGIIFQGHPDLRRLLTDYGFIGHPFRKDFPLSGHVEMRYDEEKKRVIYQPVSIEPRVLVPRVIREEGFGGRNT
ncbi:MAG: NADH-quinone oxidoreductase subunit C [Parasphingorhabdus sp.]|jgi:NADH-quinone oxidoreductase subunit C